MVGTVQEDYLMGGDGNDVFVAGRGNDGTNGGKGIDRLVVSGVPSDYILHVEGRGYQLIGPDGNDYLVNVEEIAFEDGRIIALADLAHNSDGSIDLASLSQLPVKALGAPMVIVDAPIGAESRR
jgi:Ca2+-binding RTX toxin-like protein